MSSSRTRLGSYFLEKTGLVKTREDPLFKARYARAREVLRSSREALVSLKAWSSASSEAAKQSALAFEAISELFPPHDDRHQGPCESGRTRTGSNGTSKRARSSSGVGSRVVRLDVVHEASASDGSGRSLGSEDCECAMDAEEKGSTPVTLRPHADDRIARIVKRVHRAQDEIEGVLVPVFREHVISVLEDELETNAKAVDAARSEEKASRRCFEVSHVQRERERQGWQTKRTRERERFGEYARVSYVR